MLETDFRVGVFYPTHEWSTQVNSLRCLPTPEMNPDKTICKPRVPGFTPTLTTAKVQENGSDRRSAKRLVLP